MFCYQCQETAKGSGCTIKGVCGKTNEVANAQDVLIYSLKGLSILTTISRENKLPVEDKINHFILDALFTTITNANFDKQAIIKKIHEAITLRDKLKEELISKKIILNTEKLHESTSWKLSSDIDYEASTIAFASILSEPNEDLRSLRELIIYGLKGMAAYAEHAYNLGFKDEGLYAFMQKALAETTNTKLSLQELINLVLETGKYGVTAMALLDKANTTTYGNPEITQVNIGVGKNPGILISGHDLKDIQELLEQTENTGVDVYTHSEMLPAHYYPAFKKYKHFIGNYGNAWWKQKEEFESFNGPILFTTNCLVPPADSATYKNRVFTTGSSGFAGFPHIPDRKNGKPKDFSDIIALAKTCKPPVAIEQGSITGGFAHHQVISLADNILEAIKTGAIKKFVVMAGCDGRMKTREYYTDFAKTLPQDTVILTAGCAKYRYNKLQLQPIGEIPRVLDAGQCNDSYSLAVIALKLKEIFKLDDINKLPIVYNIAWYEQKAVIVLLALLSLGVKNIHLGPTLPGFLSENVKKVLISNFNLSTINTVEKDIETLIY